MCIQMAILDKIHLLLIHEHIYNRVTVMKIVNAARQKKRKEGQT